MRNKFPIIFLLVLVNSVFSQNDDYYKTSEDSLRYYSENMVNTEFDSLKLYYNSKFTKLFLRVLRTENSFDYPFDSLKKISRLKAPDNSFKIITWGYKKSDGTYNFYGMIQMHDGDNRSIIILKSKVDEIINPELAQLNENNWLGAIYYQIIMTKSNGRKYYTLLGWEGMNFLTQRKIIEVLSFRSKNRIVFGATLFKKYKEKVQRVVFEYSSRAVMRLHYEKQTVHNIKYSKDRKQTTDKERKINMIVFDRLAPIEKRDGNTAANLTGQYQYYVPETNIVDAFLYEDEKWYFVKEIDARNPAVPRKKKNEKNKNSESLPDNSKPEDKEEND